MQNASILYRGVADFSENYFKIKPSNAKKFLLLHAFIRQMPKQSIQVLLGFFCYSINNQT